jgi:hypothetical protein
VEVSIDSAADAIGKAASSRPDARPKAGSNKRVVLKTLGGLDGRTAGARRRAALRETLLAGIGANATPMQHIAAENAASLIAISEDAQARRLAGDPDISLDDVIRAASAADRAVRRLGIKPPAERAAPAGMDALRAHVAAKGYGPGVAPVDVEDDDEFDEDELDDGADDEAAGESSDATEAEPATEIAAESETQTSEALAAAAVPSGDDGGSEP